MEQRQSLLTNGTATTGDPQAKNLKKNLFRHKPYSLLQTLTPNGSLT